uniref:Salivary secreted peptide n=1 Tax=Bracon brevicornis TaxID=1563983 RepID=A0A6V7IVR8_9HYME
MFPKCVFVLAFVAAIFIATNVPSEAFSLTRPAAKINASHNLIAGSRLPGDRLTYQEYIIYSRSPNSVISVQKTFNVTRGERITQVLALDQITNGSGGYAKIIKGGPGLGSVTINFMSQRSYGLRFRIQVFSRR